MKVQVKLFATVRDQAGAPEITLDLPNGATIIDAAQLLARQIPAVEGPLRTVAYAVNRTYAPPTTRLNEDDELAIIPPVSGG